VESKLSRIIDANINRVAEGLRVVEDIIRFYYNNENHQTQLKSLRHQIRKTLNQSLLICSRDISNDVGFKTESITENDRQNVKDLILSNLNRSKEGLRVLEEIFKIESPKMAAELKKLRYKVYAIEKEIITTTNRPILKKGIYLIISNYINVNYIDIVKYAIELNLPAIQLRCKNKTDSEFLKMAEKIRELTQNTDTLVIINDRPDIAVIIEADGVHLGQDDLPPQCVREMVGQKTLIGLSTHSLEQAHEAIKLNIDYIGFGPIWETKTKGKEENTVGLENLKICTDISPLPVVAIGGVSKERLNLNYSYFKKCNNVAVINAIRDSKDPYKELFELKNIFTTKVLKNDYFGKS